METKNKYFSVVFEDNHLIAVNKHPGMLVQGDSTGDIALVDLVKKYIKSKYHKPGEVFLGVIHRIDRPVSGLVIFARTSKALSRMNELFRNEEIKKTYLAVCQGAPDKTRGVLENWMKKDSEKNKSFISKQGIPDAKFAELSYEVIAQDEKNSFLKIQPKTGRPHQIRLQLSNIRCPIIGDVKYGAKPIEDPSTIYLHGLSAVFIHPVSKESLFLEAPVPETGYWCLF